jgi:hypothetical protein
MKKIRNRGSDCSMIFSTRKMKSTDHVSNSFPIRGIQFNTMSKCANTGCYKLGTFRCSGCQRDLYCGIDCQKGDWRGSHKLICGIIKKLSQQFQSFIEVERVIKETRSESLRTFDILCRISVR